MHPLIAAIKRLPRTEQNTVEFYLQHKGASVYSSLNRIRRLQQLAPHNTEAGKDLFLAVDEYKKQKRRFRKIVRSVAGSRAGSNDPYWWDLAAHNLRRMSKSHFKKKGWSNLLYQK